MQPLSKQEFVGKFCKLSDENFTAISKEFAIGRIKRGLSEYRNLYVTSDSHVEYTSLNVEELTRLKLREIELIDGFWYDKPDKYDKSALEN